MIVRPWAEFTSDLPEDVIEDDEGFVETGGRSVIHAIAEILAKIGCDVEAPRYADEHGWDLSFRRNGRWLWCQVTLIEGYIFIMEGPAVFPIFQSKKAKANYREALTLFADAIAKDPRFHDVRWYLPDDVLRDRPGAKRPIEE
jgi:hypothetical protein